MENISSKVLTGVLFSNEEDMRDFDRTINDDNYYLKNAKKVINDYVEDIEIYDYKVVENGVVEIELSETLYDYIMDSIDNYYFEESIFHNLIRDVNNYKDENGDVDEVIDSIISSFVCSKLEELEEEINSLVKFRVK